jgi:hypothetical protein
MEIYLLALAFFVIATVYSSVGFGGGSSYLALLALSGLDFQLIRPTVLLCNIVVVAGGTYVFLKDKRYTLSQALPFVAVSLPLAYLGGLTPLKETTFFILLGVTLVIASVFLWILPKESQKPGSSPAIVPWAIGGFLGYLSGLVSIGGGIFLSPILHFLRWADARTIAGLASFFILVNSAGGLVGQLQAASSLPDWMRIAPLLVGVVCGGQLGSRFGSRRLNQVVMKRITAVLIFVAALFILQDHL